MAARVTCPVCHATELIPLLSRSGIPRYNLQLHRDRDSALRAARGDVDFYFCQGCQFAFNAAFDQSQMDYAVEYESSRASSRYFTEYLEGVCRDLNDCFPVAQKTVAEIGCGDGQFLLTLRARWPFKGYGVDRSLRTEAIQHPYPDLQFIRSDYGSQGLGVQPEVLILRHILEHQQEPHAFLAPILSMARPGTHLYVEVPAWEWIVEHRQIQAFSYEHCSYYSRRAIEVTLGLHDFAADRIARTFGDEYLQCFSTRVSESKGPPAVIAVSPSLRQQTEAFARMMPGLVDALRARVSSVGRDAVLWGAAGKGTTLLNILGLTYAQIEYVVDSNPARHETFIPGTGQRVVAPEFLTTLKPQYVLLTNPLYREEIRSQLAALTLHPELIAVDDLLHSVAVEVIS